MLRQRQEIETHRRLPNFLAPPTSMFGAPLCDDFDFISNPSEEGLNAERRESFLGADPMDFTLHPSSTSTPACQPLPPLPRS